jgi:pimeloyl-ACP methyl ester carboxylesterase
MTPEWLDRDAYPFRSHFLNVDGGQMHYLDEGQGEAILFVHGTPTWSYLYRHMIRELRTQYRCIALDHIGFGLSAKPPAWNYSSQAHAHNLASLIDHLKLDRFTLVAHDLGGPIALAAALNRPDCLTRLILFNTLMWPMQGTYAVPAPGRILGGPVGRLLYLYGNVSPQTLLPLFYGDRAKLTPAIHRQYLGPFPRPEDRHGMFAFAREVTDGARFNADLWEQRAQLAEIPALLIWGMKDPAFGAKYLSRWREVLPHAEVHTVPGAGHCVQEEAPDEILRAVRPFLAAVPATLLNGAH